MVIKKTPSGKLRERRLFFLEIRSETFELVEEA
jgi:hypothetical protein